MTPIDVRKGREFIDSGHFSTRPGLCIAWLNRALDHIAQLDEAWQTDSAWQTQDRLRVEVQATGLLRITINELITELDSAMKDLQRFKCGKHPNAMIKVECTICRTGKHVPA